jgi:tetratricopeptide (TPR) repeat protein
LNTNERALQLLEQNRYEESLDQFQKTVQQKRTVQSLTNLAWMYCNEMEEDEKAFPLLQEAISLNPTSPFPFRLLGEMYLREEKWLLAEKMLIKSINTAPSKITYYNLGIAYYKLGQFKKAASYFLKSSDDSDYSFYGYVVCLIKDERKSEAKKQMKAFRRDAPNFVGEIEVAELYVELHCYKEAVT